MNLAKLYQQRVSWVYAPILAFAVVAFFALSQLWLPLPPSEITLSAGLPGGMYQEHAKSYRQLLQTHGITLNVMESAGTGENLQRLKDPSNTVQVAFVQSGYALGESSDPLSVGIQTLAQVDIEPIWVFSRFRDVDSLLRLQGQRVAIGQPGSGSRAVALRLLNQVRLEAKDLLESEVVGLETVKALREGKLDATVFVASVNAPLVQALLNTPGIYLANLKRSAALGERMPYLDARFAAAGSLNASRLQPPQDMVLLSTVASVLVREDVHPMIKRSLMHVMLQQHSAAGPLHRSNEFPHLKRLEFPSTSQARDVLREGLPWLERHVSVQVAQWLYRLLLIGLPLALAAWMLCKLIPGYLIWRIDSRINRWYGELKFIENDLNQGEPGGLEMAQFRTRLRDIGRQVAGFPMPKNYMQRMFLLQQHIALVSGKMQARLGR
jgi:uncharacterized protein